MRDRDKPFVMYRHGPLDFIIVPRGFAGWFQFAVWLALLGALVLWFVRHAEDQSANADFGFAVILFGMGLIGWLVGMLWWMLARAEIVEMAEYLRDRQKAERKRRRAD